MSLIYHYVCERDTMVYLDLFTHRDLIHVYFYNNIFLFIIFHFFTWLQGAKALSMFKDSSRIQSWADRREFEVHLQMWQKRILQMNTIRASPLQPEYNMSSAYHFGPVCVRILLAQNRVMAETQVPVQAAVPAAQALVQPSAAPANVDNPQQNPAPFQVLISFFVICWLDCFSFSPIRLRLVIPRGCLLVPFSSLRKHQVSVVLLFSLRPLPQFARVLILSVMFLCASLHHS